MKILYFTYNYWAFKQNYTLNLDLIISFTGTKRHFSFYKYIIKLENALPGENAVSAVLGVRVAGAGRQVGRTPMQTGKEDGTLFLPKG